jgi:ribosomal protein S18 acetylase RimI-like enzyme
MIFFKGIDLTLDINIARDPTTLLSKLIYRHLREDDLIDLEWKGEFKHFRRVYAKAFQRMQKGLALHWVVELPGEGIIGQIFIQLECDQPELANGKDRAYFFSFRVLPQYQGLGIGSKLLDIIENDLHKKGIDFITCNVGKINYGAQRLYMRHGYHIVAHEPGIWSYEDENGNWHDVEEPAWRMEKRLKSI